MQVDITSKGRSFKMMIYQYGGIWHVSLGVKVTGKAYVGENTRFGALNIRVLTMLYYNN